MLLPLAVAPTTATVRPGSTVNVEVVEQRRAVGVAVGEVAHVETRTRRRCGRATPVAVRHLAGGVEHGLHPVEADDAARELPDQPAQRPDREGHDRQQVGDGHHVARVGQPPLHAQHARPRARRARRGWAGPRAAGSKAARIRPARDVDVASWWALRAKRSVSSVSRPSVLTTRAPSNDSCATSLSSAAQRLRPGHQRRLQPLVERRWRRSPAGRPAGRRPRAPGR